MTHTLGILLDYSTFKNIPRRKTGYEHIELYNKAAKELDLRPFYMCLRHTGRSSALGFKPRQNKYLLVKRKIPKVIHNRAIILSKLGKRRLQQLAAASIVFNRENRYGKYRIHKLLFENRSLRTYLPEAFAFSRANLGKAMKKYDVLFIKPISGSVGKGIIKITKEQHGFWHLYVKKGTPMLKTQRQTIKFIKQYIGLRRYLIQEGIMLANFQGRPYDLRVSVQRGGNGEWKVTGIVGKVAAKGRHVTNIAKGGKVRRCEELFGATGLPVERTKQAVHNVSLAIARYLGDKLRHLADIGLDMGVDRQGNIKFIEMNGRDQRITFHKAKLLRTFYLTYETPLQYAKHLLTSHRNM